MGQFHFSATLSTVIVSTCGLSLNAVPHLTGAGIMFPPARSSYVVKLPFAFPCVSRIVILAAMFSMYFSMYSGDLVILRWLPAGLSLWAP